MNNQASRLLILFIFSSCTLFGQKRSTWIMGYSGGGGLFEINFHNGIADTSSIHSSNQMNFYLDCASICNSSGNVIFYTNGIYIANALHDTMVNGNDISPGPFANIWHNFGLSIPQGAIVLPDPGDSTQYYLFHDDVDPANLNARLRYSKIDMSMDGGLGAVIQKNILLSNDSLVAGELTAVKHANGRDWWLVCHLAHSDVFYVYLITPLGIQIPITQNIGGQRDYGGQACFSPNGERYVSYDNINEVELFSFDRCSGIFGDYRHIIIPDSLSSWGSSFSPNSNVLYVSDVDYLYQINLLDTNTVTSIDTVAIYDGFTDPFETTFGLQTLADDGKIYITGAYASVFHLHVINYPDSIGQSCGVSQHSFTPPGANNFTIPNYPFYELGSFPGSICDSISSGISETTFEDPYLIFPNPAKESCYLNFRTEDNLTDLKMFNSLGAEISTKGLFKVQDQRVVINTSKLYAGVYWVELILPTKRRVLRLVKD